MELEKQFFDTFGIEPKYKCTRDGNCYFQECSKCGWHIRTYPQITDRILLELICIMNEMLPTVVKLFEENLEDLKNEILDKCILNCNIYTPKFKHQVQALFKE